mmetsp:Transcript_12372/g.17843  ORF Transcript_12372/g.17843 Transcript_12372/m.17843 type:complete len:946 (-) Transcript_12372:3-2840(-)
MGRNAVGSGNLAALTIHSARMLRDLKHSAYGNAEAQTIEGAMLVGKARATCGALNLLRLLCHCTILACCGVPGGKHVNVPPTENEVLGNDDENQDLQEAFVYREKTNGRQGSASGANRGSSRDSAGELLSALIPFISVSEPIPEVYDASVLGLSLLLSLLSTQIYQPMVSSAQKEELSRQQQDGATSTEASAVNPILNQQNYFLDRIMYAAHFQRQRNTKKRQHHPPPSSPDQAPYTNHSHPQSLPAEKDWAHALTSAALTWLIKRPPPPPNSIASHHLNLLQSLVESRGEKPGVDGLYENHAIVLAHAPKLPQEDDESNEEQSMTNPSIGYGPSLEQHPTAIVSRISSTIEVLTSSRAGILVKATKGVLKASSRILLIPYRLVKIAVATIGLFHGHSEFDQEYSMLHSVSTRDVIWLSDSPLSDLGWSVLLLLTHNYRATGKEGMSTMNSFRIELGSLQDNRWEGRSNEAAMESFLPHRNLTEGETNGGIEEYKTMANDNGEEGSFLGQEGYPPSAALTTADSESSIAQPVLTADFESLFESFGSIVHTESGALLLYTFLQSSPAFSAAVAARSDLDTLVMPLLRTLYFSTGKSQLKKDAKAPNATNTASVNGKRNEETPSHSPSKFRPFRSRSQLYLILILLLLFSQDASFGPDAFRRVTLKSIPWYKERVLKDINLGSLILLVLLRCITCNLNRLQDAFFLSNCCAVLLNIAPNVENLHSYASMRLASVTISCMKRFGVLVETHGRESSDDLTTLPGMYGEASRALLQLLKQTLRNDKLEKNLHLVYALVYLQDDFDGAVKSAMFTTELGRIPWIIAQADSIIRGDGQTITAVQAMDVLRNDVKSLKTSRPGMEHEDSNLSDTSNTDSIFDADCTFTYEEEADPEIFFVPYVWEVIVCVVTASFLEWNKSTIRVFPLVDVDGNYPNEEVDARRFTKDVGNMV